MTVMKARPSPASVADYCEDMEARKIIVNHDYQRDNSVWSTYARSYFIESVILGYPIPKVFLYVRFDLKTRKSLKEIVDGQQRSHALHQFYKNSLRISSKVGTERIRGLRYRDLSEEDQEAFLSYSLSIDEFSGVGEDEIRESFTRMNANNVALNAEELRNAKFQGEFKWFIVDTSKIYREVLIKAGVLSRRDVIRMSDTTMYSDLIYIFENGFQTTKATQLDSLYKANDFSFPMQSDYSEIIASAIETWTRLDGGAFQKLCRKHIFYTYLAAVGAWQVGGLLDKIVGLEGPVREKFNAIQSMDVSLSDLNNALDVENPPESLTEFVTACSVGTNVGTEKLKRFAYLYKAVGAA